jgi:general secretion pathway protein A
MYTSFFGLNEKPFAITPDPRYLFMSERHGEGLAHLLYGVTDSGGFIQLTGEVGTGKTTLVRTLLGQLPEEVDVALILNPQVSVLEFLQAICRELGVALPEDRNSPMALVDALNHFLLDAHSDGRRIILLVDEAQNLSDEVLEQLRLLTNLETAKQKLLQIILIGQPELREVLAKNHLRQLAQRVTGRYHLEPLSQDEASRYIEHRLKVAGAVGQIFDESAKRDVHRLSGGVPRLMNVICDRALLGAYSREQRVVDRGLVRSAAAEVSGDYGDSATAAGRAWKWAAGIGGLALAVALGFGIGSRQTESGIGGRTLADAGAAAPAGEAATLLAVAPEPAVATDDTAEESPAVTAAEARLGERLIAGDLSTSTDAAMAALLALWRVDFDVSRGTGCSQAQAAGLSCLFQRGSWGALRQLDRPAILTLTDRGGASHQALLTALHGDVATLMFGDETITVPTAELADLWLGDYVLVWHPHSGSASAIGPGMRGPSVTWLRQSLAELSGDESAAGGGQSDYFDATLETHVREFQRRHRLDVDGLAGERTQIIINSALARAPEPRLTGES